MSSPTTPVPSGKTAEAATGRQARTALLDRTWRSNVPLRRDFVQFSDKNETRSSVLAEFVRAGRLRALRAYLIVVAASAGQDERGKYTEFDSMVWARLFDAHEGAEPASARAGAWRTLKALDDMSLIKAVRVPKSRKIGVTLLREDGSGKPYTRPGKADKNPYLKIPNTFWTKGYDEQLGMPGLATLLTLMAERGRWAKMLPEHIPDWYGWSADTAERGLKKVVELGLVERREKRKTAPLSPLGFTTYYEYRIKPVMKPKAERKRPVSGAAA